MNQNDTNKITSCLTYFFIEKAPLKIYDYSILYSCLYLRIFRKIPDKDVFSKIDYTSEILALFMKFKDDILIFDTNDQLEILINYIEKLFRNDGELYGVITGNKRGREFDIVT